MDTQANAVSTDSTRSRVPTSRTIGWGWLLAGFVLGLVTASYGPNLLDLIGRPSEPLNIEKNNLRQISLALTHYQATHGTFPPAYVADEEGRPMHSWRVLILRELERMDLHERYDFDLPWDHPQNLELVPLIPSDFTSRYSGEHPDEGLTTYLAVSAMGTSRGDAADRQILLIEAFDKPVRWTEPVDISPDEIMASIERMKENGKRGFHVVLADGSVQLIPLEHAWENLKGRFYLDGNNKIDEDR